MNQYRVMKSLFYKNRIIIDFVQIMAVLVPVQAIPTPNDCLFQASTHRPVIVL